MKARTASFDPDTFRHEASEPRIGQVQISQQNHGLQVRGIAELHVACKCGRPLCALEHEWIHDSKGSALYVQGVCLNCGVQSALYLSEPAKAATYETDYAARLQEEVTRVVSAVLQLRAGTPSDEDVELQEAV